MPAPIPFVPSVIVADDPPPAAATPGRRAHSDAPTARGRRGSALRRGRGLSSLAVFVLLGISMAVFGVGLAVFFVSKSSHAATPVVRAAPASGLISSTR